MIRYDIKYEGIYDELVKDEKTEAAFNYLVRNSNNMKIELEEEDFIFLFKIELKISDSMWFLSKMKNYKKSLKSCMLSYIIS